MAMRCSSRRSLRDRPVTQEQLAASAMSLPARALPHSRSCGQPSRTASPTRSPGSYTVQLAEAGPDLTGRKLVEEATETLIAAKNHAAGDIAERVIEEAADVVYHLLALLAERNIPASAVVAELAKRAR